MNTGRAVDVETLATTRRSLHGVAELLIAGPAASAGCACR
jgi:hypothetical protein